MIVLDDCIFSNVFCAAEKSFGTVGRSSVKYKMSTVVVGVSSVKIKRWNVHVGIVSLNSLT